MTVRTEVREGDCVDLMRAMPDASVDAIVTDPPYGLGFMGREWDGLPPGDDFAVEALRVLKPGGHLLAFGGTRTYHRLACAVEDAGFEIRDRIDGWNGQRIECADGSLAWYYGSGFPKSLDVSKAIDKLDAAAERDERAKRSQSWLREYVTPRQVNEATGTEMGHHLTTHPTQPFVPTPTMLDALRSLLPPVPDWLEELVRDRAVESANMAAREVVTERSVPVRPGFAGDRFTTPGEVDHQDTLPHTPEAAQWSGWGTALKPAHEPIVVARKPLAGTVAGNVLEHGTGALNVDGCRVATTEKTPFPVGHASNRTGAAYGEFSAQRGEDPNPDGRWPANVVLDPEAAELLDERTGEMTSPSTYARGGGNERREGRTYGAGEGFPRLPVVESYGDSGGASRFFYVAKASRAERNAGLIRCGCETFAPSVNGDPSRSTPSGSDTPPPRATTVPTSEGGSDTCTTGSGSRRTAPSPPATTSTTSTGTNKTTGSRTSDSSIDSPTSGSTPRTTASEPTESGSDAATSAPCGSRPPSSTGTSAERDGSSTDAVDPATSGSSSPRSSGGLVCPDCDGIRGGHPTVKPIALMRWLVRLVTPPGGTVLDPFTGSGTTGCACALEGFDFIGMEREPEYAQIARARIAYWTDPKPHDLAVAEAEARARDAEIGQETLDFGEAA